MTTRKPAAPKLVAVPASTPAPAAAAPKPAPRRRTAQPRPAKAGDIGPLASPAGIEGHAVANAVDAAQQMRLAAMRDLLSGVADEESMALLKALLKERRLAAALLLRFFTSVITSMFRTHVIIEFFDLK